MFKRHESTEVLDMILSYLEFYVIVIYHITDISPKSFILLSELRAARWLLMAHTAKTKALIENLD